jgi:hypothetical protein
MRLLTLSLVLWVAARVEARPPAPPRALTPASQVAKQFVRDAGKVRLLILASPTCPACRRGVAVVVREVLGGAHAKNLRASIVWVPMLDSDSAEAARLESSLYPDKRITHFWDEGAKLAADLGPWLGLAEGKKAWDVYMVYDARAKWAARPALWMHQLDGVTLAPWLDAVKLREKADALSAAAR